MFTYKIFNNIAQDGIDIFDANNFHIDEIDPDSLILRSQLLTDADFNQSLKCIGRAGAGTNNIPVDIATDNGIVVFNTCLLYTSPSPRDGLLSRMPSSA